MKYDMICVGMALIDSIIKGFDENPVSASGYRANTCTLNIGGEAVNEAITAARLDMNCAIMCSLADDSAGHMIRDCLNKNGVDTSLILNRKEPPTPVTTMFVNDDGTRKSVTTTAHAYNFGPDKHISLLTDTKALLLGSLFRAPFDDPDIIKHVVSAASKAGVIIFADTKLPNFKKLSLDDIKDSLSYIDYITPNEDEARYYSQKTTPEDMADVFLGYGVKNVIIKLGSKGCYFKNADMSFYLDAFDIDAVDATGAGDSFVAGLASQIINGLDITKAVEFANACGAICTTAVGATTAIKDCDQIREFLER
ncbi:MAG: carbohydrate kinase family protein [Lachnospiraceae bacterium]|nr:carbohydrate kinase family protein [Lachnospiraceae bacterium]